MKLYRQILLGGLALAMTTACTDRFDSMNTDPSSLVTVSPAYILPYIQETGVNVDSWNYQVGNNLYTQMYCQYFSNTTQGWLTDSYGYNDGWASPGFWEPYYNTLKHTKVIAEMAAENASYTNIYQMARITEATNTIGMTDCFGDIPYTEAGTGNTACAYDTQKDIYYDVFDQLKEAAEILGQNLSGQVNCSANNDLIYGGDIQKWIKLANSLRLRYALRLAYIDPDKAKAEGESALAGGVLTSNDDNAYVRIDASGSWGHPLYMICAWDCFVMSKTMADIMKESSTVLDPRTPMWFGITRGWFKNQASPDPAFKGDMFAGAPNGMNATEMLAVDADGFAANSPTNTSCNWGLQAFPTWNSQAELGDTKVAISMKVMNYAEVCQLKAEAALRGWSGAGNVQANYEAGIRASFAEERAGVDPSLYTTADDETYINTGWVKWDDAANTEEKLERIITQKWICLYPNSHEAWAECRRTGYPKLNPVLHSEDTSIKPANGEFIKKIRYCDAEYRDNKDNVSNPSLNQGQGDGANVRVWWDTKRYN